MKKVKKTTLIKPKAKNPDTLELNFYAHQKMPRTFHDVVSYGIVDGALAIHTDDGTYRQHHVIILAPGDSYDVDLSHLPRPEQVE